MKTFNILIFTLLIFSGSLWAQEEKKLTAKEKRELRKQELIENQERNLEIAESKNWVITTERMLYNNSTHMVQPSHNFMMVEDETSYIQFNFTNIPGAVGLDPINLKGTITKYEIREGKPGKMFSIRVISQGGFQGNLNMLVRVNPDNTNSEIQITTLSGEKLTLFGTFKRVEDATIFKSFFTY